MAGKEDNGSLEEEKGDSASWWPKANASQEKKVPMKAETDCMT